MRKESEEPLIWDATRVVAMSMIQVMIFLTLYEAIVEIYVSNIGEMSRIFGFGMQIDVAVYLMNILAGVNSLIQVFSKKLIVRMVAPLLCTAVWIGYWGNIVNVVPNRFILLSLLGMISFYVGVLLGHREDSTTAVGN